MSVTQAIAAAYRDAGWEVVPLGTKRTPLAKGVTGQHRASPPLEPGLGWDASPGIGLVMPRNVIGIDVDDYGTKNGLSTIRLIEDGAPALLALGHGEIEGLGALPATYKSSARGPKNPSGIRFYRVPEDYVAMAWQDVGQDVETIWWGHRYAVVAPSINTKPGVNSGYEWYGPDGTVCDPPEVWDLPELPEAWAKRLSREPSSSGPRSGAYTGDIFNLAAEAAPDQETWCRGVREVFAKGWAAVTADRPVTNYHADIYPHVKDLGRHLSTSCTGAAEAWQLIAKEHGKWDDQHARAVEQMVREGVATATDEGWVCGICMLEVWMGPTEVGDVLHDVEAFIRRYCVLPNEEAYTTMTLWVAHTWFIRVWGVSPRLAAIAPDRASGKTLLMEVAQMLCREGKLWVTPSSSVLFRTVEMIQPTIFIDETDKLFRYREGGLSEAKEDLVTIMNEGYRKGATVPRMERAGNNFVPVESRIFCPVMMGGIGSVPEDLKSRTLIITMRRKHPHETVSNWRPSHPDVVTEADSLRTRLRSWAGDVSDEVQESLYKDEIYRQLPASLADRRKELWETLMAVAVAAGGGWPERTLLAMQDELDGIDEDSQSDGSGDSPSVMILRDVLDLFKAWLAGGTWNGRIISTDLAQQFNSEWSGKRHHYPVSATKLTQTLKTFGLKYHDAKVGGWWVDDFKTSEAVLSYVGEWWK